MDPLATVPSHWSRYWTGPLSTIGWLAPLTCAGVDSSDGGNLPTSHHGCGPATAASSLEVADLDGLELVHGLEAEHAPGEAEFRLEGTADVLSLAEAVAFPLEGDVSVRDPLLLEGGDHHLGLVRQHDLVLEPLEKEQRPLEAIGEVDWRALPVEVDALRVG